MTNAAEACRAHARFMNSAETGGQKEPFHFCIFKVPGPFGSARLLILTPLSQPPLEMSKSTAGTKSPPPKSARAVDDYEDDYEPMSPPSKSGPKSPPPASGTKSPPPASGAKSPAPAAAPAASSQVCRLVVVEIFFRRVDV